MNEADTSRRFAKRLHLFQPSLTLRFVGIDDGISSGGPLSQIVNARRDAAEIDQIEIPQRSSTEVCYSFRLEAREVLGSETARVHDAARRRDGRLAARGAGAARRARAAHRRADCPRRRTIQKIRHVPKPRKPSPPSLGRASPELEHRVCGQSTFARFMVKMEPHNCSASLK